jgi:hypothetical protein
MKRLTDRDGKIDTQEERHTSKPAERHKDRLGDIQTDRRKDKQTDRKGWVFIKRFKLEFLQSPFQQKQN